MAPKRKQQPATAAPAAAAAESEVVADSSELSSQSSPLNNAHLLESFAEFQTTEGEQINERLPQLLQLMAAAESSETPLLMRVRFLECVHRHLSNVRDGSTLKKVVSSLVKIVGSQDNSVPLLSAAVRCFEGLGPLSSADQSQEYLAREGVDVLLQVTLDHGAFEAPVRKAAAAALDSLTSSAFRCVTTKLIHWLSNDREEDDEEQLQRERHTALSRLATLAFSPSNGKHWTEETQAHTLSLIQRVLSQVDCAEFRQLMRIASSLSSVKQAGGVKLLEMYLAENASPSENFAECLSIVAPLIQDSVEFDLVSVLENHRFFENPIEHQGDAAVFLSRAILLAARVSPKESGTKLLPFVTQQTTLLIGDGKSLDADYTIVEAMLLSIVHLSKKCGQEVLAALQDEAFRAALASLAETLVSVENDVVFAVKKSPAKSDGPQYELAVVAAVSNVRTLAAHLSEKRIPAVVESWSPKVLHPKRQRNDGARQRGHQTQGGHPNRRRRNH